MHVRGISFTSVSTLLKVGIGTILIVSYFLFCHLYCYTLLLEPHFYLSDLVFVCAIVLVIFVFGTVRTVSYSSFVICTAVVIRATFLRIQVSVCALVLVMTINEILLTWRDAKHQWINQLINQSINHIYHFYFIITNYR